MNRIASVLAGTLATALSGAAVAGLAASQGVFESSSSPAHAADVTAAEPSPAVEATSAPALETPQVVTRVVYVDKEPVVYTQDVRVPASASAAARQSGDSSGPSAVPSATAPAAPVGVVKPKSDVPTVPVTTPVAGTFAGTSPGAGPSAPVDFSPAAVPKTATTPGSDAGGSEVHTTDGRSGEKESEHEADDDHETGRHK